MSFRPNYAGGPPGQYEEEAEAYGRDLFFDGDLHVDPTGDYVTVEGVENLRRAIIRRIMVRPGEYRLRPNYGAGMKAYVKKRFTNTVKSEIEKRIAEQLAQEPRIRRVISVEVTEEIFNTKPYFKIALVAEALGRRQEFRPFMVPRES